VTDGQTDRNPIANTRSQQYLPVQLSRVKNEPTNQETICAVIFKVPGPAFPVATENCVPAQVRFGASVVLRSGLWWANAIKFGPRDVARSGLSTP